MRGLPAGLSRLTSRFDVHVDDVADFKDSAILADGWLDRQPMPVE